MTWCLAISHPRLPSQRKKCLSFYKRTSHLPAYPSLSPLRSSPTLSFFLFTESSAFPFHHLLLLMLILYRLKVINKPNSFCYSLLTDALPLVQTATYYSPFALPTNPLSHSLESISKFRAHFRLLPSLPRSIWITDHSLCSCSHHSPLFVFLPLTDD